MRLRFSYKHQNLVLDAPRGVGRELYVFLGVEGVYCLDKTRKYPLVIEQKKITGKALDLPMITWGQYITLSKITDSGARHSRLLSFIMFGNLYIY